MKRFKILLPLVLAGAAVALSLHREPAFTADTTAGPEPGALVLALDLQGPTSVEPNATGRYTLVARYADGTTLDVTDRAEWEVDSPDARVTAGLLTVGERPVGHSITVSAWFTDGLSLRASRTVTLKGVARRPDAREKAPSGPVSLGRPAPRAGEGAGEQGT